MDEDEVITIYKSKAVTVHVDEINFNDLMQMDQEFRKRVADSIIKVWESRHEEDPNS